MIISLDHRDAAIAAEILAVQIPSYRVEADLIGFHGIPSLRDTVETIGASGEQFIGYREDGRLLGVIAYEAEESELLICRLVVHPEHFRKGIASRLLEYVLQHMAEGRRVVVSTGRDNEPAIALYKRYGFEEEGTAEVAPGFWIADYVRGEEKYFSTGTT